MAKGSPGRDTAALAGALTPRRRRPHLASAPCPLIQHLPWATRQVTAAQQAREYLALASLPPQLSQHEASSPKIHPGRVTDAHQACQFTVPCDVASV